jgi:uncharacterized protein
MQNNAPSPAASRVVREPAQLGWLRLVAALLALTTALTTSYAAVALYIATQIMLVHPLPVYATPASLGLQYRNVTFASRYDHLLLKGWFIPGILAHGSLTARRTIIILHGDGTNRADAGVGILDLSGDLSRHGFAVLAFDMRGEGESPPAARSFGLFEERDVLGAVDFLRSGAPAYPELGRPRAVAGWGVSLGGAALLLAAAREPAIRALVCDSAFADILPILERDIPVDGHLPAFFTPGGLLAAHLLYGVDYYHTRPLDVIAAIAPRPLLLIQGADDDRTHRDTPPSEMFALAAAARAAPDASVQTWLVPGATHAQAFHVAGSLYVDRLVAFFDAALGSGTSDS